MPQVDIKRAMNPATPPVVVHPTAVVRARYEPVHKPFGFPVGTVITDVPTRRELAPQPPAYSAFDRVGRDHGPRINRHSQAPSIREWLSVMAWPFQLVKQPIPVNVKIAPHQGQTPFAPRVNIEGAKQSTLGSQTSVQAPVLTPVHFARLGGAL